MTNFVSKSLLLKLSVSLFSSLLFLLIIEAACRFFYDPQKKQFEGIFEYSPVKTFTLKKNFRGEFESQPVITNSHGHRDTEVSLEKADNEVRVLLLGDSISFGHAVAIEEAFSEKLQTQLQKTFPDKKIEVMNAAVPGNSSFEEYYDLQNSLELKPDIVLIQFALNDLDEPFAYRRALGGEGVDYHNIPDSNAVHYFLSQHSAAYLFLQDLKNVVKQGTSDSQQLKEQAKKKELAHAIQAIFGPSNVQLDLQWDVYLKSLHKIFDVCKEKKLHCYMVPSPLALQLDQPDSFAEPQQRVIREADRASVPSIHLLPQIREIIRTDVVSLQNLPKETSYAELMNTHLPQLLAEQQKYFLDGMHYTKEGHSLVSGILFNELKNDPAFHSENQ